MNTVIFSDNYFFIKYEYTTAHYMDNRHGSPRNYIGYLLEGNARIVSEKRTLHLKSGDIFFIPKGLSYQSFWQGESRVSVLSYGFYELNTHESMNFPLQIINCDAQGADLVAQIPTGKITSSSLGAFYRAMAYLMPLLGETTEIRSESTINRAKHYIRENPHLTITEIANICSLSPAHLYSLFKRVTGVTPNHYRQQILCERAVELLTSTDKKVEEISRILKFSSSSYFRKVLKIHTGASPAQIRKQHSL